MALPLKSMKQRFCPALAACQTGNAFDDSFGPDTPYQDGQAGLAIATDAM